MENVVLKKRENVKRIALYMLIIKEIAYVANVIAQNLVNLKNVQEIVKKDVI